MALVPLPSVLSGEEIAVKAIMSIFGVVVSFVFQWVVRLLWERLESTTEVVETSYKKN